jgi:hypothetical protein
MTIRTKYMKRFLGSPTLAAAALAKDLTKGDDSNFKQGYTVDNAILAALNQFPEAKEIKIRELNGWEIQQ